jgi:hypothetical protein
MVITASAIARLALAVVACLLAYRLGQKEMMKLSARIFAKNHGAKLVFAGELYEMLRKAKENPNDTIRAFTDKDSSGVSFIIDVRQNLEADNG